ncbi:MAG: 30S ribosomal protein S7 [Parcubacteria group bacterium GW2011_GWA1_47_11]|uniref:Small ribosomal subunit protein uS7 n=1 Tax=Candidatus Colwellbacteria bacterium GWA2_46_10 TaxID=1797684 RepID=A0A1G1YVB3_9BACT|nr:MAG: 30S ribosomal protein S7 [Parcubacteria group bacterium GW2011_GWA2_46_10]KKU56124.1 MAG: 30S ribosomal protein S7 [Parcubacteria group bacterium GW2011_GWA1_47_11]OGY56254.1 MAG: 30S ribosomal protein S7 [Candidatus Colwellbacteria bacterium GWA2_46_10]
MRKKRNYKRTYSPDAVYGSITLARFINYIMEAGKKSVAESVVYGAMDILKEKTKKEPLEVFEKALENVTPQQELQSRRVGGANYQIPVDVRPERKFVLASRWIIAVARGKTGKPMSEKLAEELLAAYNNEGEAVKKKQDVHRMAEANRAFAHFVRR